MIGVIVTFRHDRKDLLAERGENHPIEEAANNSKYNGPINNHKTIIPRRDFYRINGTLSPLLPSKQTSYERLKIAPNKTLGMSALGILFRYFVWLKTPKEGRW